jgi:3-dehydroquinate synthase
MTGYTLTELNLDGHPTLVTMTETDSVLQPFHRSNGTPPRALALVVYDEHTATIPIPAGAPIPRIVIPAGERCKQRDVLFALLDRFADAELTRSSCVLAVGGGAVTDVVAFAASVYLRGIDVVLAPTSLLAMVDAAVGGKTGIDYGGYKNIVGSFYPAREVRICPHLLQTLPEREYRSGLAEVLKAAFLGDAELLDLLERSADAVLARDNDVLREMIARAVAVKAAVVGADFTEQGERAFLNLGHTFGHAVESVLGLGQWTHGEAVAWGIARAMHAGLTQGMTDRAWAHRVIALLERYGYNVGPAPVSARAIVDAMQRDKKRTSDGLRFVLQRGPQQTCLETLVPETIIDILNV